MILKSVKLENIRSYTNEIIEFPEGSVLLAGDIGSGKSSILQAVEFALFGIKRDMPGSSLLRHGKSKGSVELQFSLNEKNILIKRNLKRGKNAIGQESGYIITDGIKKEGTATELKTMVFEFLGYPRSLVGKSKDLIYRYTVYTPQEEMKAILMEEKETRLDTLRRVFNIDKYKRIRENSVIFSREIKNEVKIGQGIIEDLDEKIKDKEIKTNEKNELIKNLDEITPKLKTKKENLEKKKEEIKKIEKNIEELNQIKNELNVSENNLKNKIDLRLKNKNEIERLETEITELTKDETIKTEIKIGEIKNQINEKQKDIDSIENKVNEIKFKLNEIQIKNRSSEELKEKISSLNICPICKQEVTEDHKHKIVDQEDEKITELKKKLVIYQENEKKESEKLNTLKKESETLKEKEKSFDLIDLKLKNLKEKIELKNKLIEEQEQIKKAIGEINTKKIELNEKLAEFKDIDTKYTELKKEFETLTKEEKDIELKKVAIEKEIEGVDKLILNLNEEINKKLKTKEKIKHLKQINNWLNDFFVNLISLMEKQIMLKLYNEFNELLQNWFNILIEDETITIRLDDEFTPIIEQNGYETDIENLSGGERTSLALAYRLSLNKVINEFIETIKTKDIIILDEPTDGFSTEQLDKIRDVLEQLNIQQIIIVSHESKIESFVDNVVRITKEEHISRVV